MSYSFRKSVSYHGHAQDELLSALQKYIRRGELQRALYVARELDMFNEIERAKPLVTNFVNRLRVSLVEETAGLASPNLVFEFASAYDGYQSSRDAGHVSMRIHYLCQMVRSLVACKKQRLVSDIKAVYFTPEAKQLALRSGDPELLGLYPAAYTIDADVAVMSLDGIIMVEDHPSLREVALGLLTAMKRKSDEGFYWLHQLVLATDAGVPAGARRTFNRATGKNPIMLLFSLCAKFGQQGSLLYDKRGGRAHSLAEQSLYAGLFVTCYEWYTHFGLKKAGIAKSHRDWVVFTIWPLLYCVRNVDFTRPVEMDNRFYDHMQDMRDHKAAPAMTFDDYVFDQHTARGRGLRRGPMFFAEEGALVTHEDRSLFIPAYRKLYLAMKKAQQSKKRANSNDDDDE